MTIRVEIDDNVRDIDDDAFPLSVGGDGCDVVVEGAAPRLYAWIGRSEGDLFVQPAGPGDRVTCNGDRVDASQWVRDGDRIEVAGAAIRVELAPDRIRIRTEVLRAAPEERSNVSHPTDAEPDAVVVRPIEFRPRSARIEGRRRSGRTVLRVAVAITFAALALAAWFVVTARAVEIRVEPVPDRLEVRGGLGAYRVGDRYLLRPGRYTVEAVKDGYHALDRELRIEHDGPDVIELAMEKLPGFLTIRASNVDAAEVLVDAEPAGALPSAEPFELAAGPHDVRVRAPRHADWTGSVTIDGAGSRDELEVELVPRWAAVTFRSIPDGAEVLLDGAVVGRTPVTVDVGEGSHRIGVRKDGYVTHRDRIDVVANRPLDAPAVTLARKKGHVEIESDPSGATVTVDGTYVGTTPVRRPLDPDRDHDVDITLAGHEPAERTVRVAPDETRQVEVRLVPRMGDVRVEAKPVGAEIRIDGESVGTDSVRLSLSAVPHRIEVRKPGFEPYNTTVTPRPDFPTEVEVLLKTAEQIRAESIPARFESAEGHVLVRFEGGRFRMGASRREPGRRSNEAFRDVEITRPFYLSVTEVSNEQFRAFREDHRSGAFSGFNLEIDTHPVVRVTWEDAARYCNWLSDREGLPRAYRDDGGTVTPLLPPTTGYRLPTEAEWAFAARFAGRTAPLKYPWGDALPVSERFGNFADVSASDILPQTLDDYDDGFPSTCPVTAFGPNERGLHQIGGNVAEWVQDVYAVSPSRSGKVGVDPTGPAEGTLHVIRGSSWMHATVSTLRLSYRDYGDEPRPDVGFRIARYWKVPE